MKAPSNEAVRLASSIEVARSLVREAGKELHRAIKLLTKSNRTGQLERLLVVEEKCWQTSNVLRKVLKDKDIWRLQV